MSGRVLSTALLSVLLTACGGKATPLPQRPVPLEAGEETVASEPVTSEASTPAGRATLSVYVVDVGQGDSTVILGPTVDGRRKVLLMDAGHYQGNRGKIVAELLGSIGITSIDYVVLSHYDADHMGGFTDRDGNDALLWTATKTGNTISCSAKSWFPVGAIADTGDRPQPNVGTTQWLACAQQVADAGSVPYWRGVRSRWRSIGENCRWWRIRVGQRQEDQQRRL